MPQEITRVTFCIPASEIDAFKTLAESLGISVTNAIRKAFKTELFLAENEKDGAVILIETHHGDLMRIIRS